MKITLRRFKLEDLPNEFKKPEYYINTKENSFIKHSENILKADLEIKKINFFVGENNSGKSRFLRGLIKLKSPIEYISKKSSFIDLIKEKKSISISPPINKNTQYVEVVKNKINYEDNNSDHLIVNYDTSYIKNLNDYLLKLQKINKLNNDLNIYIETIKSLITELNFTRNNTIKNKVYIPVLRSLLRYHELKQNTFNDVINTLFFEEGKHSKIKINSGLDLWQIIYTFQKTPKRRDIEKFAKFLSKHFFNNKKVELLANESDDKPNLISIAIDEKEYRTVNEIGDGIQSLIILLFPIFTASKNDCFYIEEPEINLHPAFQKIFIETILNDEFLKTKNLKYFFTTHSNHLLDLTLLNDDISIFQFKKIEDNKHLIKTNIKPNKEVLDLLGVTASSVFLSNTSIWVEGPTDRKYLSKFLKVFSEKEDHLKFLKEDIDFSFFEYGGNLIEHYLFNEEEEFKDEEIRDKINAFSLSNKIFLLADNDNAKKNSKKDKRRINLENLSKENKNFKYQNTELKEIENLLPKKIIQDFMKEILNTETSKLSSQKIIFSRDDYKNVGLGKFYEDLFIKNKIPESDFKSFKSKSETLSNDYKIKLASFVIGSKYTFKELFEENKELKHIIEKLYKFITN